MQLPLAHLAALKFPMLRNIKPKCDLIQYDLRQIPEGRDIFRTSFPLFGIDGAERA
jgi:hypothetical protein